MRLNAKDWICLVDDAKLEAKRAAVRKAAQASGCWYDGVMRECLWRQISIVADAERISLSLMNVDAEAAAGGYWRGGEACVDHEFTWEDLFDTEFIGRLLAHEQVCVYQRATVMLEVLKERIVPLREALAAL